MTPAGLEPATPGSVGRCLIHWATGPYASLASFFFESKEENEGEARGNADERRHATLLTRIK